jgi:hypothetical protein
MSSAEYYAKDKAERATKMRPYLLRIMSPGSDRDVLDDIHSDTPIGTISVGDLLDLPQTSHPAAAPLLRVVGVEHQIYSNDRSGFVHLVRLFTEEVPDTGETRLRSRSTTTYATFLGNGPPIPNDSRWQKRDTE